MYKRISNCCPTDLDDFNFTIVGSIPRISKRTQNALIKIFQDLLDDDSDDIKQRIIDALEPFQPILALILILSL